MQTNFLELTTAELTQLEYAICEQLAKFFSFGRHSIFFPQVEENEVKFIGSERLLLMPLLFRGKQLGAMRLEGVRAREVNRLLPHLPHLSSLILDRLFLEKVLSKDVETGLDNEATLFAHMEREVEQLRAMLADPGQSRQSDVPLYRLCLGMLVLAWKDAREIAHEFDHEFQRRIYRELGRALVDVAPADSIAAPIGRYEGRYEFGLLFPITGRGACDKIAKNILSRLECMEFRDAASGGIRQARLNAGHALYPQDMLGEELRLPVFEQALRLRARARLAASLAERGNGNIMAFAHIARKCGRILEVRPDGKLRINLGLAANAREGMRFQILAANGRDKGSLVLLETGIKESVGELVYVSEAGVVPEAGDRLLLLDPQIESVSGERSTDDSIKPGEIAFSSHAQFLGFFAEASQKVPKFVLGIVRLDPKDEAAGEIDQFLAASADFIESERRNNPQAAPQLSGRYGSNGAMFFHGDRNFSDCVSFYEKYAKFGSQAGLQVSAGCFEWPFLSFSKGESEDCALKALEYAQLLPEPHIGVFDSLALNISADKRYSLGDTYGAIEEYKLALLADGKNAMARNSLGVCMAALGKIGEAKRLFEEAMRHCLEDPLKAKISYNLGTIFQKDGELREAARFYRQCVKLEPAHVFAWLRLGQIYEKKGRKSEARKCYNEAAAIAEGNPSMTAAVDHHLARLESGGDARERLHDALLRNPDDHEAMLLLANIYIKDDPAMAELMARKSVDLNPCPEGWDILAKALAAQGKMEEAELASARAART